MKELDDEKFRNQLNSMLPQAKENEWFTRKVINRLPEKSASSKFGWIENLFYAMCGLLCGFFWVNFALTLNINVITVGEVVKYVVLLSVTGLVLWQVLRKTWSLD